MRSLNTVRRRAGYRSGAAEDAGGPHLHVLAALPNTIFIESGPLPEDGSLQLIDGCYPLPETPGRH